MLAYTKEANNDGKYSGMASSDAQKRRGKIDFFVEGKSEVIKKNTDIATVMKKIKDALETTCYYTGSRNQAELYGKYGVEK
jgi:hypothetical protein